MTVYIVKLNNIEMKTVTYVMRDVTDSALSRSECRCSVVYRQFRQNAVSYHLKTILTFSYQTVDLSTYKLLYQ